MHARTVDLTRREWAILECLALHAGQVVAKDRLQQAISSWEDGITTNAVEVYISRLRGKLGDDVGDPHRARSRLSARRIGGMSQTRFGLARLATVRTAGRSG